jgi:cobalt/nickel transport system ATP-binding protein
MDPDVLVFDEPTSGLDPSGSEDIMELLDELNHGGKTLIISTHDVELAYPWADRAILMLEGKILQEDVPEIAFGNPESVRAAHLSLPTLLELHMELQKRGVLLEGKKPRTVLDMMHSIDTLFAYSKSKPKPGIITIFNVDLNEKEQLHTWCSDHQAFAIGAMGTRAKQFAETTQISLDFTYGVIDKCILKSLLGEDSLILTIDSMVDRIHKRITAYGNESGICIPLNMIETGRKDSGDTGKFLS